MRIGKRIRELRKEKKMTLEELSTKSGVALATLSRMENGRMAGTMDSHERICKALNTSLAELYRKVEDESKTVEAVTRTERIEHFSRGGAVKYELLVPKASDKKLRPLIISLSGGGETQEEQDRPGKEKFLYLLAGALEVSIGKKLFSLKCGDSLYFDASLPHTFKNRTKKAAEALCVISP